MNYHKYLISIIVNCHNGEMFINRCIESILNQSHSNFEIIFYDNQSTDNTYKIIRNIKDNRIKYFKTNKFFKLYEARNLAIKEAKGEFIAFLDIDDTWEKNKLIKQIKLMLKTKSDICFTNHWVSNNKKILFRKNLSSKNIFFQIINDYPISILTVMIRRSLLIKKRIFFDKRYEIIGDFDLFYRLSNFAKFCCIDEPLATYYIHGNNLSIKKIRTEILEFDFWIKKNKRILNEFDNQVIEKNNLRKCNYLLLNNRLNIFSKEINLLKYNYKLKIYIKIILKNLGLL